MVNLTLPYDTIDTSMYSFEKGEHLPDVVSNCTYVIRDASSGLWHATNVLSMLVDISMESASSHDATPAFQDYLAWILESFLLIHELRKRWEKNPTLQEACKKSKILSFCTVHALLSSLRKFLSDSILRKGYALLSILCADLLECSAELTEKSVQINLCSSILNLVAVCQEHDSMRQLLSLHLIPTMQTAMGDESVCTILGKDFQVGVMLKCVLCLQLISNRKPDDLYAGLAERTHLKTLMLPTALIVLRALSWVGNSNVLGLIHSVLNL
jgi:serine/threonine-protein kinase ATR